MLVLMTNFILKLLYLIIITLNSDIDYIFYYSGNNELTIIFIKKVLLFSKIKFNVCFFNCNCMKKEIY